MLKQIENYHISKSECGIITLIVNTVDKWVDYGGVFTYDIDHKTEGFKLKVYKPEDPFYDDVFLYEDEFPFDKEKEFWYLMSHSQEKDQIYYYWIPVRLIKGDEWVEHLKSKRNEISK